MNDGVVSVIEMDATKPATTGGSGARRSEASAPRTVPGAVREAQIAASDPAASAWVAANAGSGKTYVLAQRVIRLLLEGIEPAKILCITFTKAAAANMALKVFDELRRWTALDDTALDAAIREKCGRAAKAADRARARRLFALALDTPGGLKVQTIHAFCTRLLHQFPFEANVAARFTVLDEPGERQLLTASSLHVLLEASLAPEGSLGRALTTSIAVAADRTFKEVVAEAIRKRAVLRQWLEHGGSVDGAIAILCGTLGIAQDDTLELIEAEITQGAFLPMSCWGEAAKVLAAGSKEDQAQGGRLSAALAAPASERARMYLSLFFTDKFEARQRVATKKIELSDPELAARLENESVRLKPLLERRKAVLCRDRTAALLGIAEAVIARYQKAKDERGLLDYDDLIEKSLTLLREDRASWVHYKLDQGIDHVLIDEAQDTSPKQWEIIQLLTGEFFVGHGARAVHRTIFAVGDEKQSIFSFQGAAPHEFDAMRKSFQRQCKAVGQALKYLPFHQSFRSGANVLGGVDAVFARPQAYTGLAAEAVPTVHEALPNKPPGVIEIWETIKPHPKREIEAWDAPFDDMTERSPQVRLAAKIADHVRRWIGEGARAGDVLVLVRQRGALFEAIIRALKDAHVDVAGADRLVLNEHIAVMDLLALADALLLPADDLALATILKSPLFGLNDAQLFELAWERKSSLRATLDAKADSVPELAQIRARLDRFAEWARQDTPFGFYARVLGPEQGRRRFLERLGHEANDALDELLNLALDYERRETPSLQGFVAWLRAAESDVKRDMEITRDEVRVMTVHGAKGLEARIVVLADTTTPPAGPPQRQPRLLGLTGDGCPDHFVWAAAKAHDVPPVASARKRMQSANEEEHRRLLYVAMTRAIDRLVVCGAQREKRPPDCWWDLVADALQPLALEHAAEDGDGSVWRYRPTLPLFAAGDAANTAPEASGVHALPAWLTHPAQEGPVQPIPVSPSRSGDSLTANPSSSARPLAARHKAIARGLLMHRLLQSLPDVAPSARADAARDYLARAGKDLGSDEQASLFAQAQHLLAHTQFAPLFLPGSRAEVPIVGRLKHGTMPVSGQVDRLAVTADSVLIADYKTNSTPPRNVDQVPAGYVRQLALYRAVLSLLYPHKPVRAALIWTEVPDLMEIPPDLLDRELARVTGA